MITKNEHDKSWNLERNETVNGELLTLTISHKIDQTNPKLSGWFVCILTHDAETGEVDWGFSAGYTPSYTEAITKLKSNPLYKIYPFPI